jgi:hypothetical protein
MSVCNSRVETAGAIDERELSSFLKNQADATESFF